MKRYMMSAVVVLTVLLVVSWVVLAQEGQRPAGQGSAGQGPGQGGGRGRGGFLSAEEQQKTVEAIEQQVGKLKEALKAQPTRPEGFQDLSEEERAKFMEKMTKAREERQTAIRAILAQLARLQGQVQPPAEGEQFIIVNTADLKALQTLAEKEKATDTAARITALIEAGQRGGRGMGRRMGQQDQPGGERGARQREGAPTQPTPAPGGEAKKP